MSKIRFELIKVQNSLAELREKQQRLETVGDNLKVLDYDNMQTVMQTKSAKIDARNKFMAKMRHRHECNIQDIKNFRIEREMIEAELKVKEAELNEKEKQVSNIQRRRAQARKEENSLKSKMLDLMIKSPTLATENFMRKYNEMHEKFDKFQNELMKIEAENKKLREMGDEYEFKIGIDENSKEILSVKKEENFVNSCKIQGISLQ